ncbi:hypothetical protein Cus16_0438 [Curtobacterium sp. ER1/6]|nr:hypothetical protein Cus16_0438 [Curtobacterium sp. ER1/6]
MTTSSRPVADSGRRRPLEPRLLGVVSRTDLPEHQVVDLVRVAEPQERRRLVPDQRELERDRRVVPLQRRVVVVVLLAGLDDVEVRLEVLPHPLDRGSVGPGLASESRERVERLLDRRPLGVAALLADRLVLGEGRATEHGGQDERLPDDRDDDDTGGDEHDEVAVGEGPAGLERSGDRDRHRQGHRAAEAGEPAHEPVAPSLAGLAAEPSGHEPDGAAEGALEGEPDEDEHDGHGEHEPDAGPQLAGLELPRGDHRLDAHEHEQRAVEQVRQERPEGADLLAGLRPVELRRDLAHHDAGGDDGEHAGGTDRLGAEEGREGHEQRDHVLEHDGVDATQHERPEPRGEQPGRHAAHVGEHEHAGHVPERQLLRAHRHGDRDAVDDERRAVVHQALRAEHRDVASRQHLREHADGGGVGGRDRRAEHPGRPPRHAEQVQEGGDDPGRHDDEQGAHEDDAAQVLADLAERRRQALPVQERREEQQEDGVGGQLDAGERRHEGEQRADHEQQHGRGHPDAVGDGRRQGDGEAEGDHQFRTEHGSPRGSSDASVNAAGTARPSRSASSGLSPRPPVVVGAVAPTPATAARWPARARSRRCRTTRRRSRGPGRAGSSRAAPPGRRARTRRRPSGTAAAAARPTGRAAR